MLVSPLLSCNKHRFGSLPRNTQPHQSSEGLRRSSTPFLRLDLSNHPPQFFFYESLYLLPRIQTGPCVAASHSHSRIPTGCEPNLPTIRQYTEAGSRVLADCYDVTIGHQNRRAVCNLTNKAVFFIDWPAQILMRGQPYRISCFSFREASLSDSPLSLTFAKQRARV